MFNGFGVQVKTSHRLLGGVVGDQNGMLSYVEECVEEWIRIIEKLVTVSKTQPQMSYYAYTMSMVLSTENTT